MSEIMDKGDKLSLNLNHLTHELDNNNTATGNYHIDITPTTPYATYSPKLLTSSTFKGVENPAYVPEGEGYVCKRNVTNNKFEEIFTISLDYFQYFYCIWFNKN